MGGFSFFVYTSPMDTNQPPQNEPRSPLGFLSLNLRRNVTEDESAPEYYSQRLIYVFSILFSPLFGAILLAINLKRSNKKGIVPVIAFGIGFTALSGFIIEGLGDTSGLGSLVFGLIGSLILLNYFWDVYLGDTKYRARSAKGPIIVAIVLAVVFISIAAATHSL